MNAGLICSPGTSAPLLHKAWLTTLGRLPLGGTAPNPSGANARRAVYAFALGVALKGAGGSGPRIGLHPGKDKVANTLLARKAAHLAVRQRTAAH